MKYDFLLSIIVDMQNHEPELLDYQVMPVNAGLDNECYYDECASNADLQDFLPNEFEKREDGVYRLLLGVVTKGTKYWTDCGYEYDAWEEYEIITDFKYTDHHAEFMRNPTKLIQMEE